MAVSLIFLPKKSGDPLRWAFLYELKVAEGFTPTSITVLSENNKPISVEVKDSKPALVGSLWSATSKPNDLDERAFNAMTGKDPWILQRKFQITYSDGTERALHQLAIITNPMRFRMLEQVIGKPLSDQKADRRIDSRSWKVGYEASNSTQQLTEFVLPGQTVESWQELFTRQLFADPERKISIDKLIARIREGFTADCRNLQWSVVRQEASEIIYQWSHDGCNAHQPQFEVARLARTSRGICRWAYASKQVPVAAETQKEFRSIVEKLECD